MERTSERLLTVFQCEDITGRKVATWRKAIAERRIPVVRIGRSVRVPHEYVQELIAAGWEDAVAVEKEAEHEVVSQ
jgi:excisionase family DNA binding protein